MVKFDRSIKFSLDNLGSIFKNTVKLGLNEQLGTGQICLCSKMAIWDQKFVPYNRVSLYLLDLKMLALLLQQEKSLG